MTPKNLLAGIGMIDKLVDVLDAKRLARIAELEAELAAEKASDAESIRMYRAARDRALALEAELAGLRADAGRFELLGAMVLNGEWGLSLDNDGLHRWADDIAHIREMIDAIPAREAEVVLAYARQRAAVDAAIAETGDVGRGGAP